jgi:hypothetical protein
MLRVFWLVPGSGVGGTERSQCLLYVICFPHRPIVVVDAISFAAIGVHVYFTEEMARVTITFIGTVVI